MTQKEGYTIIQAPSDNKIEIVNGGDVSPQLEKTCNEFRVNFRVESKSKYSIELPLTLKVGTFLKSFEFNLREEGAEDFIFADKSGYVASQFDNFQQRSRDPIRETRNLISFGTSFVPMDFRRKDSPKFILIDDDKKSDKLMVIKVRDSIELILAKLREED